MSCLQRFHTGAIHFPEDYFQCVLPHLYFGSIILRLVPISLINNPLSKFTVLLWLLAGIFMHQMKDSDFFFFFRDARKTYYLHNLWHGRIPRKTTENPKPARPGNKSPLLKSSLSTSLPMCNLENKRVSVFTLRTEVCIMKQQELKPNDQSLLC